MHVVAGKAVTFRLAATPEYRERMARTVAGAQMVAERLVAAEAATNVRVLTGGTDVHQVLVDTAGASFDGTQGLGRLHAIGVNANDIRIAHDARPAPAVSGIRLGTAPLATRGLDLDAFAELGTLLAATFGPDFEQFRGDLAKQAAELAARHPIYEYLGVPAQTPAA
jgi:glycine hydroxymethyltransferase